MIGENGKKLRNILCANDSEVRSGQIVIDGVKYSIALVRSRKAPEGHFLVANVKVSGETIWNFRDEKFDGIAVLMKIRNRHYVCFVSRDRQVEKLVVIENIARPRAETCNFENEELKQFAEQELGLRTKKK